MIFDDPAEIASQNTVYDIIIIGSGPAGVTLALEMEGQGQRVAILESGGRDFDDRAQELNDGNLSALDTTDVMAARLRMLGGTSNHWGGHCLPLDPIDFDRAPLSGLSGWPVTYNEMVPYYTTASDYLDIGRFNYAIEDIGVSNADLIVAGDDKDISTKLIRQSEPTNFGEKYADQLEASQSIDVFLFTTVVGLEYDSEGTATKVLAKTIDALDIRFNARYVVLACGAVENARLLLYNNARTGKNFGNQSGYLGACYMDHPVGGAAFLHLTDRIGPKANWSHDLKSSDDIDVHLAWQLSEEILTREKLNNIQFFTIPAAADATERRRQRQANAGFRNLKNIAKWGLGKAPRDMTLSGAYCGFIQNADDMAIQYFTEAFYGDGIDRLLLRYESEQQPSKDSYVALEDQAQDAFGIPLPRLHWSPSLDDRDSIIRSAMQIGVLAGARDLGRVELEDHFELPYWDAHTAWHQMGTTRMSISPNDGVVDSDSLLHGTKNVYVAGASVFPSGGRANPTMTVVALAIRLAEHLLKKTKV